jgi:penicillin-binding protein 2
MMGLGQKFDIFGGKISEASGNLADPGNIVARAVNDAIGQGDVQIPPIQMAVATAAIANNGTVYKPYLVKKIGGMDGVPLVKEIQATVLSQPDLQPDVLPTVREGMCGVVSNDVLGTAWYVFYDTKIQPSYTLCGKTGTAQTGSRSNAWFIAYAPADDPQIAIVVAVKNGGREGSEIAAPIARRILDDYFGAEEAPFPDWWAKGPYEPLPIPKGAGVSGQG